MNAKNTRNDSEWMNEFCKRLQQMNDALGKLRDASLMKDAKTQADAYADTLATFQHLVSQCEQNPEFLRVQVGERYEFEGDNWTVIRVGDPRPNRGMTVLSDKWGGEMTLGVKIFLLTAKKITEGV